jgi:acyl-CoA synthetase (AMP-forming)/AMP-acid ligase II
LFLAAQEGWRDCRFAYHMRRREMQTSNPLTFPAVLAHAARTHGKRPAIIDGETQLGFQALEHTALQAAAAFLAAGIGTGDRVAIWAPNSWRWIVACLGAHIAGAAVVPLNTRLKGAEAAYILSRSRAGCLITEGMFLGVDHAALLANENLPDLRLRLRFDTDWTDFTASGANTDAACASAGRVMPEHPSDILFTSGTTGQPKGVVATHGQSVRVFQVWAERVGLTRDDRYLVVNPFFHTFGYKAGWLACLLTGATCYPMAALDVARISAIVPEAGITVLPGPPTLFVSLLDDPGLRASSWAPLASLRVAVTGAASIAPALIDRMRGDLGIGTVLTGYGLTESCGVVTMSAAGDDAQTVAQSCGFAIPGVELRIAAAPGAPGEVLVRGYNIMQGYFEDPKATRAAIDADGWLHTGDIGWLDTKGYLRITDRLKDMYISGGFNCYPAEVERMLAAHPDIAQVAVIGVPDDRMGEVGMAFVVPRTGALIDQHGLRAWARQAMANYKVPRHFRIVESLPTNASGKITKMQLRPTIEIAKQESASF